MTDYSLVKNDLMKALNCDDEQINDYESYINNAIACVASQLKNPEDENDARVVNLCAMRAYYQIILISDNDDITSFKAGDISYTKDTSSVSRAKALLDMAIGSCSDLVQSSGFAFKAV
ncbi:MAG: hypothetical protein J1E36_05930 [Eubacterium sp.]|nr:hypothetical protein [Eubacterium sp.]